MLVGGCGTTTVVPSTTAAAPTANFAPTLTVPTTPAGTKAPSAGNTSTPSAGNKGTRNAGNKANSKSSKSSSSNSEQAPTSSSSSSDSTGTVTTPTSGGSPPASTVTVNHTVTVTVYPSVPQGAHVPSGVVAHVGAFETTNGNVGCELSGAYVRCDIAARAWSPPPKPSSCQLAWGQGLAVGPSGAAHFVCAGDSALDPGGIIVQNGVDDKFGSASCQVRYFGVTCFDAAGHGFFISRTGYATF